jgi:hypothetical protein
MCHDLLELLEMEETFGFARVVTGDESWLYLNCSHTHMSSMSDDNRPVRIDQTIANEKHVLTVLWSIKGPLVIEWLGPGDQVNTTDFCDVIIPKSIQTLYPRGAFRGEEKIHGIWIMLALTILQGQLNLSTEKMHPITPLVMFAGYSIIRRLFFGMLKEKFKNVPQERLISSNRTWPQF